MRQHCEILVLAQPQCKLRATSFSGLGPYQTRTHYQPSLPAVSGQFPRPEPTGNYWTSMRQLNEMNSDIGYINLSGWNLIVADSVEATDKTA